MSTNTTPFQNTALDHAKLKLRSERWGDTYQRGTAEVSMVGNYPRLTVWPRNPKEKDKQNSEGKYLEKTPIVAPMSVKIFTEFMNSCYKLASKAQPGEYFVTTFCRPKKDENGKMLYDQVTTVSKVRVGIDSDGIFYMTAMDKDRRGDSAVHFKFTKEDFATTEWNGEPQPAWEQSKESFLGWIDTLKAIYGPVVNAVFKKEEAWQGAPKQDAPKYAESSPTPQLVGEVDETSDWG